MKPFIDFIIEGSTMHPTNIGGEGDVGGGLHTGGNKKALRRSTKKKKPPAEKIEINPTMEAHINKQNVPVYVPIPGKRGHHKVVGHVRRNTTSIGAAKIAKSRSAFMTMKLVSPQFPEGPGWIAKK